MKKGCFITTIAVATIVVGTALYLFQNHFDTIILPGKKMIAQLVKKDLEQKLEFVIESPEKNELKKILTAYAEDTEALKKLKENDVNKIIGLIESAVSDSMISKSEIENISQLLKLVKK